MSDSEATDVELVPSVHQENGFTYYGRKGSSRSTLVAGSGKLILLLITVIGTTSLLLIGFLGGAYFGTGELPVWFHLNGAGGETGAVGLKFAGSGDDPFERFIDGGIRFGSDYGLDTINQPLGATGGQGNNAARTKERCSNRRCCHPANGAKDGKKCYGLSLSKCCELEDLDVCDWNCDGSAPNRNANHSIQGGSGRSHNKRCFGHSDKLGKKVNDVLDEAPGPDCGKPGSGLEIQKRDNVVQIDQCGDTWIDEIDDSSAEDEANGNEEPEMYQPGAKDTRRRRMGQVGTDDQQVQLGTSWPQDQLGLVTFNAVDPADGVTKGYICSGTKVSAKNILTAGHCCHSGQGGSWNSNWLWYPGITQRSQVTTSNARSVSYATALVGWTESSDTYGFQYDICWLTLSSPYYGYMGFGYDNAITTSTAFDFWGYPAYKYGGPNIKWGDSYCSADFALETNLIKVTCDTSGGQSGSGLFKDSNNIVYAVNTYEACIERDATGYCNKAEHNGFCRITADKYTSMVDNMVAQGGWNY